MFREDASAFLADFALPCVATLQPGEAPVRFNGTLDAPATIMGLGSVAAHSIEYELTYPTADVALVRGLVVRVDGVAYACREAPRPVDDGLFSTVLLSKV